MHHPLLRDDELSLDALTAGVSVYQRKKGHRFSSDDLVTAWVATQVCPAASTILDLGCGIGSVLLHLAWSVPGATLVGVEAQDVSFALLERNVAHNGLADRVTVHHGDLRDEHVVARLGGPFELVTGTPPYFPPESATDALDPQRAHARIEYRGGVEAYVATAARLLAPGGWFVVCGAAGADDRVAGAASSSGMAVCGRHVVIPRAGRPPLFAVWTLRHLDDAVVALGRELVLRDADGERTADARLLRAAAGFPERPAGA